MDGVAEHARAWFDRLWNERRAETLDEFVHPDARFWGITAEVEGPISREVYAVARDAYLAAFPDLRLEVLDSFGDDALSMTRFRATGTHRGAILGMPPSGRRFDVVGATMARWSEGRIVASWTSLDRLGMMRQLRTVAE